MKLDFLRQMFRPLFGLERFETIARFLYVILGAGVLVDCAVILWHVLRGESLISRTLLTLIALLLVQVALLLVVKWGYVDLAALLLVSTSWAGVTYQAWNADGIHDAAIYVYILIIFVAALITNWPVSLLLSILSIAALWFFAILEARGLHVPRTDPSLHVAGDLTAIFSILFLLIYLAMYTVRQSLNEVRAGEAKFRTIFQVSPVAIAISSLESGYLIAANDAYWKLTGFEREAAIGKSMVELGIWSNDLERSRFVARLKAQGSLQDPEYRIRNQAGEYQVTLAFYELIDFERQPAILAMFYDVTDQRKTQAALQASEQKYRNFVEQSMEGIWFLAFDQPIPTTLPPDEQVRLIYQWGYVSDCNDVLAHMYGYASGEEMRGARLLEFQSNGQVDELSYQATLRLIHEEYRSGNRETRERTRDGRVVYFLNNAVGILEGSSLIGIWGTQLDITALKNTEDAWRRSESRMRALLDALPDMIFEFTRDGTIIQFIPSSVNAPLLPPEQFLGKAIGEVLPSVADQTLFAIERVLESGHVHAFEYPLSQAGETRTFEARIAPLSSDTVLAIVRDVSLQRWILGEREKLINELESKNAELERFTYTVSHDLKSPLITIKGFLGFLRQDAESGNLARLNSDIRRISDAADKMQALLNDLLELSRIGRLTNQPETIQLNRLIVEVLELLYGRIHEGHIRVNVEPGLPEIYGDRQRLFEVLQNLIDNAAKFMGDQPAPCIEIGQEGATEAGVPILFVRDNGMGIDPRFKDRIFGLFDKLDPRSDGTGIGLALARRIIEFHGGRIWVESEPAKGATFYFTIPHHESVYPKAG